MQENTNPPPHSSETGTPYTPPRPLPQWRQTSPSAALGRLPLKGQRPEILFDPAGSSPTEFSHEHYKVRLSGFVRGLL